MGMTIDARKRVVLELLQAFEGGDSEAVLSRLTDDATWWVSGDLPMSGTFAKSEIAEMMSRIAQNTVGPVTFRPTSLIAENDRVAVEAESSADLANGRRYTNRYHLVFQFDGELVSAIREYMDTLLVHRLMFE
jgi:ketosteroid isomerase-like protein